ncbi:MAG: hypothetical protein H2174_02210 [Vampirovibrio sp.]|nr:hypothetical protein [Vampirovibrio sp.]
MRVLRLALIMALLFPFAYCGLLPVHAGEPSTPKPEAITPQEDLPVSKRAFAQFLVSRFELPTQWVSTFPLFADVELSDPDFVYLDTAYRYHLLFPNDDGYFHSDEPTTQVDAWLALGKVLFPNKKLSHNQLKGILPEITGQEQLQAFQKPRVAMLYLAGIISTEKGDIPLEPNKPITQGWLNTMVTTLEATKLLLVEKAQNTLTDNLADDETADTTPTIPPKTFFTITPSQAIIGKNLVLNDVVYFQLKDPIRITKTDASYTTIPATSSVQGKIVSREPISENVERFTVAFQWVRSAENEQLYKLNCNLVFSISTLEPKRSFNAVTRGYLISGQDVFIVVTE